MDSIAPNQAPQPKLRPKRLNIARALPPGADFIQAEKPDWVKTPLEKIAWSTFGVVSNPFTARIGKFRSIIPAVHQYANPLTNESDRRLRERVYSLRFNLRCQGFQAQLIAESFALIREVAGRTVGMRHFDSQLLGGHVILSGAIAEMQTGEGKTLTATLPAATAAIAGVPTHVVSVNDYLTKRDAEEMGPIYKFLGLSVGCVVHDVPHEERKIQYASDITYCCNKDLTFDYLRDRMVLDTAPSNIILQSEKLYANALRSARLMQRGLHYAILDEADSVLVDEARTPLIISASKGGEQQREFMEQAHFVAKKLIQGQDYKLNQQRRFIVITDKGRAAIADLSKTLGSLWSGKIRREEAIHQALTAQHLFKLDEHYIVDDGKVQIIDENTGRVMPDRSWERGLHQLIELKENCEPTDQRETLAKLSYQRFFSRYLKLSGMTGTAKEVKKELWDVYGLRVIRVPTHKPSRRKTEKPIVVLDEQQKWQRVMQTIEDVHHRGAPLLVGTRSVAASEHLAKLLDAAQLPFRLLNAKSQAEEANIVAEAGQAHHITIATNMAGRGTDIKLTALSKELNGLHVILTERFEAGRIDRQLAGRCARQGDPGVYIEVLSIADIKEISVTIKILKRLCIAWRKSRLPFGNWFARKVIKLAQKEIEKMNYKIRKRLLDSDNQQNQVLSFTGRFE